MSENIKEFLLKFKGSKKHDESSYLFAHGRAASFFFIFKSLSHF